MGRLVKTMARFFVTYFLFTQPLRNVDSESICRQLKQRNIKCPAIKCNQSRLLENLPALPELADNLKRVVIGFVQRLHLDQLEIGRDLADRY